MMMRRPEAAEALLRMASSDEQDAEIRTIAYNGLAALAARGAGAERAGASGASDLEIIEALRKGLDDTHVGAQLNAAYALGLRGDVAATELVRRSLDRKELERMKVNAAFMRGALVNAMHAAEGLGDPALRARVADLAETDPDDEVRAIARKILKRWRTT